MGRRRIGPSAAAAAVAWLAGASPALSQPVGDQMCGDGTTFTVNLPGDGRDIDDSEGLFRVIDAPPPPPDSVTLPNGCRIYAILVSGYANNRHMHDWPFYKVAEFVARHNGYVHFSWWNNLLKEYLAGPLHPRNITVRRLFGVLDDVVIEPGPANPQSITSALSFAPDFIDLPKANPDEDYQFQQDAALVIRAIRQHNPDALIIVAGHSMGGNAVARLGMNRDLEIDLLAPIDPVGNRDKPRAIPGERSFNWTRWRAAHEFRGYRQWDCVRSGIGICQDFDPRLLHLSFRCIPVGPFLPLRPLIPTRAPIACPRLLPYADPGTRLGFGANIRHLYHRWQHEFIWPVDFPATERFNHPAPLAGSVLGPNYQQAVLPSLTTTDPNRTCVNGPDPRDPAYTCEPTDGHGEIIGHRGPFGGNLAGIQLTAFEPFTVPRRRELLIDLAGSTGEWAHSPVNPDLCIVCDGMLDAIRGLLAETPGPSTDLTGPVVAAEVSPGPTELGWNNGDVVISLTADDGPDGSGVRDIVTVLSGAQPGGTTTAGAEVAVTIGSEGETTLDYYATDLAGNAGDPRTLGVRIDLTPPELSSSTNPPANAAGWHNTDVSVTFNASDALSGLAVAPVSPTLLSTEGLGHMVTGVAEDRAGNAVTASVTINLDKTVPVATIHKPRNGTDYLVNSTIAAAFSCADALSGVSACEGPVGNGEAVDTTRVGVHDFPVDAVDAAGNLSSATVRYGVRYGFSGFQPPRRDRQGPVRAGRAIPIRWRLFDARDVSIGDRAAIESITSAPGCKGRPAKGAIEPAAGRLQYQRIAGRFVFVWQTARDWSGSCRTLELRLADGSKHRLEVSFRRAPAAKRRR